MSWINNPMQFGSGLLGGGGGGGGGGFFTGSSSTPNPIGSAISGVKSIASHPGESFGHFGESLVGHLFGGGGGGGGGGGLGGLSGGGSPFSM